MSAGKPYIIDSHIHLFPTSELDTLFWAKPGNPLYAQHSVEEYLAACSSSPSSPPSPPSPDLRGFIFVETDRKQTLSPETGGWEHPLEEVDWLRRIALGTPKPGEGHIPEHKNLVLGIVPWAPVPAGANAVAKYAGLAKERAGDAAYLIKGFRYLVQDKSRGTMLGAGFVEGMKWLGREGWRFDLGVDARSGGLWQLGEAVEMLEQVFKDVAKEDRVVVIINHLCKPNLYIPAPRTTGDPDFLAWKAALTRLASFPTTYLKLSGLFSEIPPGSSALPLSDLLAHIKPWTDVAFEIFGLERILFGSDWPVCNIGGEGNQVAWRKWREVVDGVLKERGLSEEEKRRVWGGNAAGAYGIDTGAATKEVSGKV